MSITGRMFRTLRSVGTLDKAWNEAVAKGWTVVSMQDDWKTIFPPGKK